MESGLAERDRRPSRAEGRGGIPFVHATVVHMLADAASRAGGRTALACGGDRLTYDEYLRCVAVFARELQTFARRGDRVALACGNGLDMAIALFAVHAAGCQAVPVNPAYTARELRHILSDAAPAVVLHDATARAAVLAVTDDLALAPVIELSETGRSLADGRNEDVCLPPMPAPEDMATLQYTGGTTGLSKGVNITHGQLSVNIAQREAAWSTVPDDEVVLCVMPLYHVFASSTCLHLSAYCRGAMVILPRFQPETVLEAIETDRVTRLPVGATVFGALMAAESFARRDLSSLRSAYSGAAALPEETLRRWQEATGCPILEAYGQSEAGPVLTGNCEGRPGIPGSVGPPLPGTVIEIVDVETGARVLPVGATGEIRAQGPQIMSGYRNRPEEDCASLGAAAGSIPATSDGSTRTATSISPTARRTWRSSMATTSIRARSTRVLFAHPAVREAAAVGVPDARKGRSDPRLCGAGARSCGCGRHTERILPDATGALQNAGTVPYRRGVAEDAGGQDRSRRIAGKARCAGAGCVGLKGMH